ncbi:hypothetical protein BGCPKDLD_2570 [Methylorubrum suomiense]|uniref:Transposase DDE domain-containing protein n=1 Tax=Methylorubrum suomiense TaxID=144191 RepID=A0ABQ4UUX0_9HYPH|nr:hypothetical protein BGCPKDLD_2570 [Methylorubrum suomiense]
MPKHAARSVGRAGSCRASPAKASSAARGSAAIAGSSILRQAQDEGTHAWFNRFRRLPIRYERRADIDEAFTSLAASLITINQIRRFC